MEFQYIIGLLVSASGFMYFMYSSRVKRSSKKASTNEAPNNTNIKASSSTNVNHNAGSSDVIIVGAGVAGSALAYTLGKVRFP